MAFASPRTRDRVVNAVSSAAFSDFSLYADAQALANPAKLHHMYDWVDNREGVGNPEARLWQILKQGSGAQRNLSYIFKASTKAVPHGEENTGIPGDTRRSFHIFYWKAAVMESGATVVIHPSIDKGFLAFPVSEGNTARGQSMRVTAKEGYGVNMMAFTKQPIVRNFSLQESAGSFNQTWVEFFEGYEPIAQQELERDFMSDFTPQLEAFYNKIGKTRARSRVGIGLNVITAPKQSHKSEVEAIVESNVRKYIGAVRVKERLAGYGPGGLQD